MKFRTFLPVVTLSLSAILLYAAPNAHAQYRTRNRNNRSTNTNSNANSAAAAQQKAYTAALENTHREYTAAAQSSLAALDPSHSALPYLLKRNDVASEILLSQREREEMTAMQNPEFNLPKFLRPEQIKRLNELDLQWRGPLVLSDAQISKPLDLTAEQKQQITALLEQYRTAQQKKFAEVNAAFPAQRGTTVSTAAAPDIKALTEDIAAGHESLAKTRQELGTKALTLLTPEQQAQWKTLQGKAFVFRKRDR